MRCALTIFLTTTAIFSGRRGFADEPAQVGFAVIAPAAAPVDGGALNAVQQAPVMAQFQPLLLEELSFANRVCRWSNEERIAAIAAGKAWLREFVRDYAKKQGQQQQELMLWVGQQPNGANPLEDFESGATAAIKKTLVPEDAKIYEAELAKRRDFRRDVVIDSLIAEIDERLFLDDDQLAKITESLRKNWDAKSMPQLETFLHLGDYMPEIPEESVAKHLTEKQLEIWNCIQRVSFGVQFERNMWINGGQMLDDIDLDEVKDEQNVKAD